MGWESNLPLIRGFGKVQRIKNSKKSNKTVSNLTALLVLFTFFHIIMLQHFKAFQFTEQ